MGRQQVGPRIKNYLLRHSFLCPLWALRSGPLFAVLFLLGVLLEVLLGILVVAEVLPGLLMAVLAVLLVALFTELFAEFFSAEVRPPSVGFLQTDPPSGLAGALRAAPAPFVLDSTLSFASTDWARPGNSG